MSRTTQDILTVVITVTVVSVIAYLAAFPMLFAHAAVEVFYYALLFGLPSILVLGLKAWYQSAKLDAQPATV